MGIRFTNYNEPTDTAPNVLAEWDKVRGDDAATEEFVNQVAAELQALATRVVRAQHTIVQRDSAIQQYQGKELLTRYDSESMSRWDHFKAAFLPY